MTHLIDKDAIVAEIERIISNGQTKLKESEECKDYESYVALAERIATCINVLSFLDTLEVKEVDLENELKEDWLFADKTEVDCLECMCLTEDMFVSLAKKYFELGLKAQKREKI